MRKITTSLVAAGLACVVLITTGCTSGRKVLFNGRDLTGWKLVLKDKTVDVHDVWSVKNGVVHCKGKPNGYMRTLDRYSNYKLHVEWRWADKPTNSGVLVHASGPDRVWPRCIENQLQAGSAGDFILIGKTGMKIGGKFYHDLNRQYITVPKKQASSEKPAGRWNRYDIECVGNTIRCYVNDVLQNEGLDATEDCGWICLQSEGSPIEFRNIYIEHVK